MILKPPTPLPPEISKGRVRTSQVVFLAGSIEQGTAPDWQTSVGEALVRQGFTVLNPRRDDWDPTWEQRGSNPQFRGQVEWELDGLTTSDAIVMYFAPGTKSPITLLELGLYAESKKLFVCCPDGFWRRGNVELVCERHKLPLLNSLEALVGVTAAWLKARV